MQKINHVATCSHCGSERLLFDAYVKWDTERQEYQIVNVFDKPIICEDCDGETSVDWKEVAVNTH